MEIERCSTVIFSCNWHWLRLFVDRYLQNNRLKDLPQDIFKHITDLWILWVDVYYNPTPSFSDKIDASRFTVERHLERVGQCRNPPWLLAYSIRTVVKLSKNKEVKVKWFLHQRAPNFYIAFSIPNQRAASDLVTPMICPLTMDSLCNWSLKLFILVQRTFSNAVWGLKNIHCHWNIVWFQPTRAYCGENQVISRHNDVKHLYEIGRKSAKLILKSQRSTLKNAKIITLHKILKKRNVTAVIQKLVKKGFKTWMQKNP